MTKCMCGLTFPNLLLNNNPEYPNHIWASDFTHIAYQGKCGKTVIESRSIINSR